MSKRLVFTIDVEAPYEGGENGALLYADLFDEIDVKATFFVTGDVAERRPDIVEGVLERGHEVGSHGWRHPYIGQPIDKRADYLPDLSDEELADHLNKSRELLIRIGADPVGFRAMQFRTNARVMNAVAREFEYDSSLTQNEIKNWQGALPLKVLPLGTLMRTQMKLGTPLLFGPSMQMLYGVLSKISGADTSALYGHSFDLIKSEQKLYCAAWKKWWYFDRCGPSAAKNIRNIIESARRADFEFMTGRDAILSNGN